MIWPIRAAWQASRPDSDPEEPFRREENRAIVLAVEKMLDELQRLATVGNDTLRPRLTKLLGGDARAELMARIRQAHQELPAVDDDYRAFLRAELDAWREGNPRAVRFLRSLDHVAALARPAITITLAVSGFMVAGDLVGQAAVQAAGHTVGGLATEAAIAGGITGGGEVAISTAGARASGKRPEGSFPGCNPTTPSRGPSGWPPGSKTNSSAICWSSCAPAPIYPKPRRLPR